ncbi:hypothetical protein [Blastochloris tepida]|uniref:hypothetical protein n=1 Tax=Blastochloris tepida TaxID=2233851 RepID=UPI000F816920|nr:hypothetical protein [Blastochloris tepida]
MLLMAGACATPHQIVDRSDFLAEATRTYAGETRERVIAAAETVLKISDPTDFEFRHTMNGFTALRRYVVYAVIASAQGREKWEFQVEAEGDRLRASVSISEAGVSHGGNSSTPYEGRMASVPLYRLFWARVDYVLGKRSDWLTCDVAAEQAKANNTNAAIALSGLCGATSDGRDAPPPPQMEPVKHSPPAAASKQSRQ